MLKIVSTTIALLLALAFASPAAAAHGGTSGEGAECAGIEVVNDLLGGTGYCD